MTYRGINFNPIYQSLDEVIDMIANKDYSKILYHNLKYPIILQIYFNDGDDVTTAYIINADLKVFTLNILKMFLKS